MVTRQALEPLHQTVVGSWRDLILRSASLGLVDRLVLFLQLQHRAEQLAALEGLAQNSVDLKGDTEAFAASAKQQSPMTTAATVYAMVSGVLGFFGLWSFDKLHELAQPSMDAAAAGAAQTAAAMTGLLTVASGGVLYWLARAAYSAMEAASRAFNEFSARDHPSSALLREIAGPERELFQLFGRSVPSRPVSAGPLILLGGACIVAGAVFAALVGIGSG